MLSFFHFFYTERYNPIRQYAAYLSKSDARPFVLGLDGDHLVFLGQVNDTGGVKESLGRDLARAMGGAPPLTPLPSSPYATWSAPRGPLGWVPRTVHVELFLADDGRPPASEPAHYRGLYLASEHISRGKFKLDLPKPKDGDARTAAIATFLHGEKDPVRKGERERERAPHRSTCGLPFTRSLTLSLFFFCTGRDDHHGRVDWQGVASQVAGQGRAHPCAGRLPGR